MQELLNEFLIEERRREILWNQTSIEEVRDRSLVLSRKRNRQDSDANDFDKPMEEVYGFME